MQEIDGSEMFQVSLWHRSSHANEYIVPNLRIAVVTGMSDREALEERLVQLEELEEERFLAGFHLQVQKQCKKAWHDCNIKLCMFKINDLVLLYDNKFEKLHGKF